MHAVLGLTLSTSTMARKVVRKLVMPTMAVEMYPATPMMVKILVE